MEVGLGVPVAVAVLGVFGVLRWGWGGVLR